MLEFIFQRKELENKYGEYRFIYKIQSSVLIRICSVICEINNLSFLSLKLRVKANDILESDVVYSLNSKEELKASVDKYVNKISTVEYRGKYKGEVVVIVVNFEYSGIIFVSENEEIVSKLIAELGVIEVK